MTDISGERRKLTAQGLHIITRESWGARQAYTSDRACDVPAQQLFLHVSVTALPEDPDADDERASMRTIEHIGQERFGVGISYNAGAFPSGRLYEGQPLTRRGAHTINNYARPTCPTHGGSLRAPSWNNNVTGRALVLPQMVDDTVTDAQIDAAARWGAAQIRAGLAVPGARWHGHRCVTAKDCPGSKGYAHIPELQDLTDRYVAEGLDEGLDMPLNDADKAAIRSIVDARADVSDRALAALAAKVDALQPLLGRSEDAGAFVRKVGTPEVYRVLDLGGPALVHVTGQEYARLGRPAVTDLPADDPVFAARLLVDQSAQ